jgi:hypothetical protein
MCCYLNHPRILKTGIIFFLALVLAHATNAQVNEPIHSTVYDYLYRMAQKGLITWNDYQLPLDRKSISYAIDQLDSLKSRLSKIETKELSFYQQEYAFDRDEMVVNESKVVLRKDSANRFRTGLFQKDQAKLFIDPLIGYEALKVGNRNNVQYFSGIRLAGYFGKRWGFNFAFRDNTDKGDTVIHTRSFSPAEGTVPTINKERLVNYSNLNFNIGYKWANGSLNIGQENLAWGYGLGGNIMLSGKAPSFPFIKFDFEPWKWLHFNYFHGWLHSNIIDSARSYNTGTGLFDSEREVYIPKFIAHHSIRVTPVKGLDIALGESVIYSDKLNVGYLIPINFFRIYDHYASRYNIKASDNSQFFLLISSRNHIKNTHAYAQVFIDEIRPTKIFNQRDNRNQLGYTLGINRTDLFIHYLTVGIEYSRINPFVYNNVIPAETYQSHSYPLGDWMGNNADRFYWFLQHNPLPKLKLKLSHQKIRKGASGTLEQQYYALTQPRFLFQKLFDYKETAFSARYEWLNRLMFTMEVNNLKVSYVDAGASKNTGLKFGINYGL